MYNDYGQYPPPVVSLKASFEKCVLHSKLSKEWLILVSPSKLWLHDQQGGAILGKSGQNMSSFPTYGEGKYHSFLKILNSGTATDIENYHCWCHSDRLLTEQLNFVIWYFYSCEIMIDIDAQHVKYLALHHQSREGRSAWRPVRSANGVSSGSGPYLFRPGCSKVFYGKMHICLIRVNEFFFTTCLNWKKNSNSPVLLWLVFM